METSEPAPIRIGIPMARLRSASPRGVVRAARAVAQRLESSSGLSLYALSEPLYNNHDVLFEAWELGPWMDRHPLVVERAFRPDVELGSLNGPRARAVATAKTAVTALGLKRPAKLALRAFRLGRPRIAAAVKGIAATIAPAASEPQNAAAACEIAANDLASTFISLNDLDALVSFECYDAIWDWPTELFNCRLIGVFHDAIPFRINEGIPQSDDRYFIATGKMVQKAHLIACDSHSSLEDLHTFFPNSKSKACVVHLGHDRNRFLPAAKPTSSNRVFRLGRTKRTTRTIAMIGELEPRKNQAGVLRACRYLAAQSPAERISLTLIGELPSRFPSQLLKQQIPNNLNIDCRGYVPDEELGDLLRSSDVFVFASLREGFGIPVLEAMSAGVPVVCSENSSLTEVGGRCVFYCDPYDPASIAAAIKRAWELTPNERDRWVAEARNWAEQFTWERCARQFEQLCLEEARRGRRLIGAESRTLGADSLGYSAMSNEECTRLRQAS